MVIERKWLNLFIKRGGGIHFWRNEKGKIIQYGDIKNELKLYNKIF